jgi:hypothetical protein
LRVIIAGTRILCNPKTTRDAIHEAIASGMEITEVVCGMAPGPDLHGKDWADEMGIPVQPFPADWLRWGTKKAGPIRNLDMAIYAKKGGGEGGLILVHTGESSGSRDMLAKAKKFKLKIFEKIVK